MNPETLMEIHLFLKEYGLILSVGLFALAVICHLFIVAIDFHEADKREAERKYSKGEL